MKLRLFALWLGSACASHHEPEAPEMSTPLASSQNPAAGVDDKALAKLLTDHWDGLMQRSPVWATTPALGPTVSLRTDELLLRSSPRVRMLPNTLHAPLSRT